ncbi:bifunctional diaminohydroxyphosphoribosylaminopyrimidine deaminase/5-amino-6-(5-phosphoribosylamino)uracil reductase RibD [Candidatus Parvarchaeota archaeon]|nr:bifunctional diaminohydroxyphosphoribosylaminopyrimidine deaminase/5-amino-6-(5-phosphoribosylamino)uracil reductase RibD [Candidatus Parvarchaeota archaeon]
MKKAIGLALLADPTPNPHVGALVVKSGKVIATGFHKMAGMAHAEIEAIRKLGRTEKHVVSKAKGATLFVTLEPCSHYGRTPPCTQAIIKAGFSRVVFGAGDPTAKNSGSKGARELMAAGIEVKGGVLAGKCLEINPYFEKLARTGLPYVSVKWAMSADGKIATRTGDSKWITGNNSRWRVQGLRARHDAVLVGIGTVMKDDARLTVRQGGRDKVIRQPYRVVLDTGLKIPLNAKAIGTDGRLVVATCSKDKDRIRMLERKRVRVLVFGGEKIPIKKLLEKLASLDISSVLVEGGGETIASFAFDKKNSGAGFVDMFYFFIAPKLIGGREAKTPVEGSGIGRMRQAKNLVFKSVEKIGDDLLIVAKPANQKNFE